MKVLHVIPSISPVRGGPSQAILEMVNALRLHGVEAEIVTTNDHGDGLLDLPLKRRISYPVYVSQPMGATVPVRLFPRFSPDVSAVREYAFSSDLTQWLCHNVKKYDLIHIHAIFSYPSTVAMAIARYHRVPYIVRPLGQLCQWSLKQGAMKKQLYLNLIERANIQSAQALHFTSVQEQEEASQLGLTAPGFVMPHGLSYTLPLPDASQQLRQRLNIPANEPIILFLSRLHPKKGLEPLIKALQTVKSHPFTFIIAGSGSPEYETAIAQHLIDAGLERRTHWLGFVSGELKQLLLQGSDLFALTSHSENFGIAALEAMANGLPVLLSSGVALSSLVQQHRLGWITTQEPPAIATILQQFLNSPALAKEMGDRARRIVQQQYSWNYIAAKLTEHYSSVVQPRSNSQSTLTSSVAAFEGVRLLN
jgi:glycosyltransferase involved in cell wall biosynthesis